MTLTLKIENAVKLAWTIKSLHLLLPNEHPMKRTSFWNVAMKSVCDINKVPDSDVTLNDELDSIPVSGDSDGIYGDRYGHFSYAAVRLLASAYREPHTVSDGRPYLLRDLLTNLPSPKHISIQMAVLIELLLRDGVLTATVDGMPGERWIGSLDYVYSGVIETAMRVLTDEVGRQRSRIDQSRRGGPDGHDWSSDCRSLWNWWGEEFRARELLDSAKLYGVDPDYVE